MCRPSTTIVGVVKVEPAACLPFGALVSAGRDARVGEMRGEHA